MLLKSLIQSDINPYRHYLNLLGDIVPWVLLFREKPKTYYIAPKGCLVQLMHGGSLSYYSCNCRLSQCGYFDIDPNLLIDLSKQFNQLLPFP